MRTRHIALQWVGKLSCVTAAEAALQVTKEQKRRGTSDGVYFVCL